MFITWFMKVFLINLGMKIHAKIGATCVSVQHLLSRTQSTDLMEYYA